MKIEDVVRMVKYPALNRTAAEEAEARDIILAALEKRILKEPIIRGLNQIYCPDCHHGNQTGTCCQDCGQRLK